MGDTMMSTGELARHFGCAPWQTRRLFERGLLPPARRMGRYRYVAVTDLPAVEAALIRAGYLRPRDMTNDMATVSPAPPEGSGPTAAPDTPR
jgi:hypothetical protein